MMLSSCSGDKSISDSRIALGTYCTITLYGTDDKALLSGAFDLLYECERKISRYDEGSYIWKINENAGKSAVKVPSDVFSLIKRAVDFAEENDGIFNPAIGPLSSLWNIGSGEEKVPDKSEIDELLPLLDWHDIILDEDESTVFLCTPGMALDLGGVGKGWASDVVRDYLEERGVESAVLNLGGNITVIGSRDGRAWRIGIQTPWAERGEYYTVIPLSDATVSTSGGYQRYFEEDGVMYHHILSSSTGYPAETDLISASAAGDDGVLLDMLSTALFASGSEEALSIAERYRVYAVLLRDDMTVISSRT